MNLAAIALADPVNGAPTTSPALALSSLLQQLRDVIVDLPRSAYVARPAPRVSGSVGEHVRHCLDHMTPLVFLAPGGHLSYDHRRRGTPVETDPISAMVEIQRLLGGIDRFAATSLNRPVTLSAEIDAGGEPLIAHSTLAREAAFVIQHTIHHYALIALLLAWQGRRVPHGFGLAPSTARARARAR